MSEVKTAYGLGQYVKHEQIKVGKNGTPAIKVTYVRQDGDQKGKEQSVQYLVGKLDEVSKNILKDAATNKGNLVIVKQKKDGDEYYNFASFADASTFVEKPKSDWKGGGWKGSSGGAKKEYDTTGVKVGAARNQAIAILTGIGLVPKGTTIKDAMKTVLDVVDTWAYEIVHRQSVMEENVKSGKIAEQTNIATQQSQALGCMGDSDEEEDNDLPF